MDTPDSLGLNPYPFPNHAFENQGAANPSTSSHHLDFTARFDGTSAATPVVAGVAALALAVNPCMGNLQMKDILLNTADKVGGYNYNWNSARPGHSKEMGYGRVNAHRAVVAAQEAQSDSLDLYMKNVAEDFGAEPDVVAKHLYLSPDIWIRNQNDGREKPIHENPIYSSTQAVYVYVRIRNKSCQDAVGDEKIKLYWSKAGTNLSWPKHWNGSITNPVLMGDTINTLTLGDLPAGKDTILEFQWLIPNPNNYSAISNEPWHFCLLSRIISDKDTMTYPEDSVLWLNVKQNNNIAWKNVTVVNKDPLNPSPQSAPVYGLGGLIAVGNDLGQQPKTVDFKFNEETINFGNRLIDDAEVRISLGATAYLKWLQGGGLMSGMQHQGNGVFLLTDDPAFLQNLTFTPNEWSTIYVGINFLTQNVGLKKTYHLHAEEFESSNFTFIGGEQYLIHRDDRTLFEANAGSNQSLRQGQTVNLQARNIGEKATYNWYDQSGKLIYQGKDTSFVAEENNSYTLEVIAHDDGYKDYDEKQVEVKKNYIVSIYPNPLGTAKQLTVKYHIEKAATATFSISNSLNTIQEEHNIDVNRSKQRILLSHLKPGTYQISLLVDGILQDGQTFSIK